MSGVVCVCAWTGLSKEGKCYGVGVGGCCGGGAPL